MGAENEKKQLEGVMLNFGNQFMKEKENWLKKEEELNKRINDLQMKNNNMNNQIMKEKENWLKKEELNKRIDDLQMKNNNMNNQIGQYQLMIQNLMNNNFFLNNQINNMNNFLRKFNKL